MSVNRIPVEIGHSEIFSELYKKYFPKLYKYTLYKVGDAIVAEDLVSEVFENTIHITRKKVILARGYLP